MRNIRFIAAGTLSMLLLFAACGKRGPEKLPGKIEIKEPQPEVVVLTPEATGNLTGDDGKLQNGEENPRGETAQNPLSPTIVIHEILPPESTNPLTPTPEATNPVTPTPEPTNPVMPTPEPTKAPEQQEYTVVDIEAKEMMTGGHVNVRTEPSLLGEVLELYQPETRVTVTGRCGEWYRISYKGQEAFLFAEYVTEIAEPTKAPDGTRAEVRTGIPGTNIVHETNVEAPWIVIDPGHQRRGNNDLEPVGPGASEKKKKVSYGTSGKWSGLGEYELNLMVSMKLRDALIEKGYNIVMIRETHEVDISNAERAAIANEIKADVFIRVHADGSDNTSASGMMTISPTKKNPYCGDIYEECYRLASCVLTHMQKETGAKNRGVWETDTMSGINWSSVPVTIVEMGFMTNEQEDLLLATEEYQNKLVKGMVDGIAEYLGR